MHSGDIRLALGALRQFFEAQLQKLMAAEQQEQQQDEAGETRPRKRQRRQAIGELPSIGKLA